MDGWGMFNGNSYNTKDGTTIRDYIHISDLCKIVSDLFEKQTSSTTVNIARGGERLGIYFLETGAAMRASNVVYDRAHSSISTATAADFDFDKIFVVFRKKLYYFRNINI